MKTLSLRKEDAQHDWYVVDASDKILGRLATKIADRIRGKDKPTFTLTAPCSKQVVYKRFISSCPY